MTLDLHQIPSTFDLLHALLAGAVVLLILILVLKRRPPESSEATPADAGNNGSENAPESVADLPQKTGAEVRILKENGPESAYQLLALLQAQGRFIDFVKEDLSGYSDQDIGAAARVVHEGAKKVIGKYFDIEPIRPEDEESQVTIEDGFNPSEIRLTGHVVGTAPFSGVLVHRGWKVHASRLPQLTEGHDARIITPAEVEL